MKKNNLLLAAAIVAAMLVQVGCTPEETTTIAPGGNPLTEAEVAPVKPTTLVGTEWVWRQRVIDTVVGIIYDEDLDHRLVFETDSTGSRHIHVYQTSTHPEEFDWPDVYPFTYNYDTASGECEWYNIVANQHITMVYNIDQDAFVNASGYMVYYRVK